MHSPSRRGYASLRRGRWSSPGTDYFLTLCTQGRQGDLSEPGLCGELLEQARRLEAEEVWRLRAATIMPDHAHLLVNLGALAPGAGLSEAVRRWKGRAAPRLRDAGLRWQRGYFDHRMRIGEDRLPVFLYVFLNPYRAGLCGRGETWQGFYCAAEDWAWFEELTHKSCPFPEWLG